MLTPQRRCRWPSVKTCFADGAYRGILALYLRDQFDCALVIVLRTDAGQHRRGKLDPGRGFQVVPRRWVVERTLAWLSRNRRLARDYEERESSEEAWMYLAMTRLLLRRRARRAAA